MGVCCIYKTATEEEDRGMVVGNRVFDEIILINKRKKDLAANNNNNHNDNDNYKIIGHFRLRLLLLSQRSPSTKSGKPSSVSSSSPVDGPS